METSFFKVTKTKHATFFNFPEPELIFKESQQLAASVFVNDLSNQSISDSEPGSLFDEDYFISIAQQ
ncbi:MAG: hypothetical protein CVU09_13010 [Bacteroidetes bacterium HGW-Bacteroidetes-4]|jgi:hypothetical protein|nr:MAG: hypothetical protein CVU09_13010 [Bacteroidetes bacterium HGW-Bacteroidetes-4]